MFDCSFIWAMGPTAGRAPTQPTFSRPPRAWAAQRGWGLGNVVEVRVHPRKSAQGVETITQESPSGSSRPKAAGSNEHEHGGNDVRRAGGKHRNSNVFISAD